MGLETAAIIALAGAAASGAGTAISAANQPDSPQPRQSFNGTRVDPTAMLTQAMAGTSGLMSSLGARMEQGVSLPNSYAQPVPGLSGVDPAYTDRSRLSYPGMSLAPMRQALATATAPAVPNTPRRRGTSPQTGTAVPRPVAPGSGPLRLMGSTPTQDTTMPIGGSGLSQQQRAAISLALGNAA